MLDNRQCGAIRLSRIGKIQVNPQASRLTDKRMLQECCKPDINTVNGTALF